MIKRNYSECRTFLNGPLYRYVLIVTGVFLGAAVISGAYFWVHPEETDALVSSFYDSAQWVMDGDSINPFLLILNNLRATALCMLYGFIPFFFLPAVITISNSAMIGAAVTAAARSANLVFIVCAGILPHGIFELPALLLAMSAGIYVCVQMTRKCMRMESTPFRKLLAGCLRLYVMIILPLLIVAGFVETYVTPWLISLL